MHPLALTTPLFALAGTACLVLLFFARGGVGRRVAPTGVAAAGFAVAALCVVLVWPDAGTSTGSVLDGFLLADGIGCLTALVVCLAGLATVLLAPSYLERAGAAHAEVHALLLFGVAGMVVMAMTDHLAMLLLGLEVMSVSLYVLSASLRRRQVSIEAGTKYFLTGAFASGILLFGIAFLYGASGDLALPAVAERLREGDALGLAGLVLVLVGFGFKLALVPFHQWALDVYDGAPTPVTAFMSTTVKLVVFVALLRVLAATGALGDTIGNALAWIAGLTIVIGNVGALAQRSVKRMLAYSSIAHAGYALLAVVAFVAGAEAEAVAAVLFYLVAYTLMNFGAFAVLSVAEDREGKGLAFDDLSGFRERQPLLAGCMLLFMLSLAGIPPTGGFLAKWNVFEVLVNRLDATGSSLWLVLLFLLILGSVVGLAYYLRVVVAMYVASAPAAQAPALRPARGALATILVCAALTLWFGFGPSVLGLGAEGLLSLVKATAMAR